MAFVESRSIHLRDFILPFFGEMQPHEVKARDVEDFKVWLTEQKTERGKQYAHGTLKSVFGTARLFFRFVTIEADLIKNPTADSWFDVKHRPAKEKEVLDLEELTRLFIAAREEVKDGGIGADMYVMIFCGFALGLRFSELSAFSWADLDLTAARYRIERSQYAGNIGPPKTKGSRRMGHLPPAVVEVLRAHRQWQMTHQVAGLELGLVFPSNRGGYRFPQSMAGAFSKCCARAGIDKHLSSHCMRHTTNDMLRRAETGGGFITRAMMGHSTERMSDNYTHTDEAERADLHAKAFGKLFKLGSGPQ